MRQKFTTSIAADLRNAYTTPLFANKITKAAGAAAEYPEMVCFSIYHQILRYHTMSMHLAK